jgi:hypothetical protein
MVRWWLAADFVPGCSARCTTTCCHTCAQDLLSKAVKHDVVVVVPCVPAAPPRLDAPQQEAQSWLARAHAFAALTSLGACPCVVLPVAPASTAARDAGSASGPLSLALFGHSRSDQRLLTVAERLAIGAQVCVSVARVCLASACAASQAASRAGGGEAQRARIRLESPPRLLQHHTCLLCRGLARAPHPTGRVQEAAGEKIRAGSCNCSGRASSTNTSRQQQAAWAGPGAQAAAAVSRGEAVCAWRACGSYVH